MKIEKSLKKNKFKLINILPQSNKVEDYGILFYEDRLPNGRIWRREWGAYTNTQNSMLDSDTTSIMFENASQGNHKT